ncbi:MAG: N-acetyltransferase [Ilumatobacter sp.]|nr:N-acetyltransferase [Ilumatobacter sp.]
MDVTTTTLAARPDLIGRVWEMPDSWDEFMDHDPIGESLFGSVVREFRHLAVAAIDSSDDIVAHGTAMAFCLDRDGRRTLPDRGWDQALVWAHQDLVRGTEPDTACALEVSVHTEWLGRGLSQLVFAALRDAARAAGFTTLVAPVRPSDKHREPDTTMDEYARRTRADGLPTDPWLRVHARLGGVIERVAPASQTVSGSLDEWRSWTGLDFSATGPVRVPGALAPVHCFERQGIAVYVEPNVWVRHDLT